MNQKIRIIGEEREGMVCPFLGTQSIVRFNENGQPIGQEVICMECQGIKCKFFKDDKCYIFEFIKPKDILKS